MADERVRTPCSFCHGPIAPVDEILGTHHCARRRRRWRKRHKPSMTWFVRTAILAVAAYGLVRVGKFMLAW